MTCSEKPKLHGEVRGRYSYQYTQLSQSISPAQRLVSKEAILEVFPAKHPDTVEQKRAILPMSYPDHDSQTLGANKLILF